MLQDGLWNPILLSNLSNIQIYLGSDFLVCPTMWWYCIIPGMLRIIDFCLSMQDAFNLPPWDKIVFVSSIFYAPGMEFGGI